MATFIIYAIRWAVTLTLLYSLYRLLLQRETFHRLNRAVLLAILVVSPLLPLVPLHTDKPTAMDVVLTRIEEPLRSLSSDANIADATLDAQESENATSGLWVRYCAYIYIVGVGVSLAVYLFRLLALMRVICRSQRLTHPIVPKEVYLMLGMRIKQPSSWMRWIFIGPIDLKQNAEIVLRHELAHVRMRHSWDVILCDLTCHMLWCLPFVWMLRQDLVDVHEFQADETVLQGGVTLEDYEHLLIRKAVPTQFIPIMNTLRRGAVKKRFAMMHSGQSSQWSRLKLLYLVPALAACLWVSAQADVYTTYLNGKLAIQERLESVNLSTIELVDVIHSQKTVLADTATESVDTGRTSPRVRPDVKSINPGTIEHVDVIHSQKTVLAETATESVDTGRTSPGVRPDVNYDMPEQKPQFPGGETAMYQYISQHIRYPNIAIENDVEGTVNVEFFVEENGSITNVKALESSPSSGINNIVMTAYRQVNSNISALDKDVGNRALQESSEELIRGMPPFEPGRKQGKAVRTKVTLPITYQLN